MPQENLNQFKSQNKYEVLGVSPNASMKEIKKAHRRLSSEWHPDKHIEDGKDTVEIMKKINEAYDAIEKGKATPDNPTAKENPFAGQTTANSSGRQTYGFSSSGDWQRRSGNKSGQKENVYQQQGTFREETFDDFGDFIRDIFGARFHFKEEPRQRTGNSSGSRATDNGNDFSQKTQEEELQREAGAAREREEKRKREKEEQDALRKKAREYEEENRQKRPIPMENAGNLKNLESNGTTTVGPLEGEFDPKKFLNTAGLSVLTSFKNIVRLARKVREQPSADISSFTLKKSMNDAEIRAELPKNHVFSQDDLWMIADLIKKQSNGKGEKLLNNSGANLFYVQAGALVFVVYLHRDGSGWYFSGWELGENAQWHKGYWVFSRNG